MRNVVSVYKLFIKMFNCVQCISYVIHFVLNTVNMETGNKYRFDINDVYALKEYIRSVLIKHQVSESVQLVLDRR